MRIICAIGIPAAIIFASIEANAQELWAGKDGNIRNVDTRAMVMAGGDMYLATRNELYRMLGPGAGGKWESVFSLPAGENEIQCVAGHGSGMLIGTRQGIFRSFDRGGTWQRVFRAITPEKNDILSIDASRADGIVAGTGKGVYISSDEGAKWSDAGGALKNRRVDCVLLSNGAVYAGGDGGVFVKRSRDLDWERIYVKNSAGEVSGTSDEPVSDDAEYEEGTETALAIKGQRLYVGAGGNTAYTDDGGKTWASLPAEGFSGNVSCVLPAKSSEKVYCATSKGVFEFSPEKKAWRALYRGSDKPLNVRGIVFDAGGENVIWAATAGGVYRFDIGASAPEESFDIEKARQTIGIIYDGEPAFPELQKAAMRFAEVDPEKIKAWRAQARLSALVPKISFGTNRDTSNTYEIYTSATKDYFATGPDDISEGVDISVSWELGKIIWSDDQTNIDVRSRLTTQLRNDILDDLRRVYYERKRLQFELVSAPPKDLKMRFEKELRIKELTQAIDDLTGNYLSEHTKKEDGSGGG